MLEMELSELKWCEMVIRNGVYRNKVYLVWGSGLFLVLKR